MGAYPTSYVASLVLLVMVPFSALGVAEEDALIESVAVHRHFDTVEPFLSQPTISAQRAISEHCQALDVQCLDFADRHGDLILSAVPDNPEFWSAYDAVMDADPLPVEFIEADKLSVYQNFIEGVNGWVRRELVTRQIEDIDRLHTQVMAHRRRLAMSNILIDKIIFTASTGILLSAINVHMAKHNSQRANDEQRQLDELLHGLQLDEISLRRVMDGELRYAARRLEDLPEWDTPTHLRDLERVYEFVADRSEADWANFWQNGLDVLSNVALPGDFYMYMPSWAQYAINLRYLDASLMVVRELRAMYKGQISPGPPATEAPYGWSWRWKENSQTLCLERGFVHESVSADEPVSICYPYLRS